MVVGETDYELDKNLKQVSGVWLYQQAAILQRPQGSQLALPYES